METILKLGISSCLLGREVRYDGGHKLDRFLTDTLGKYAEYIPVCPEVEYGLGTPREALRLVGAPESPRLVTVRTHKDHTDGMLRWAQNRVRELEEEGLCGFIFKSRSPSSGMERVKVYNAKGMPVNKGVGIFARVFMDHFPLLPTEDEGRLYDPEIRENFIERVFTLRRWRELEAQPRERGRLVEFHTKHKLLVLSHSPKHYREMGGLVARPQDLGLDELYNQYRSLLAEALQMRATPRKHVNVLQHIMGYFKKQLSSDEKQELMDIMDLFLRGHVPLIVPVTLLNHYVRKYDQPYLKEQYYLHPHPLDLRLRNHA